MGCGSSDVKTYTQIDKDMWRGKVKIYLIKASIEKDF